MKRGGQPNLALTSELTKIQARLSVVRTERAKQTKAASNAGQIVKTKALLQEENKRMTDAEE